MKQFYSLLVSLISIATFAQEYDFTVYSPSNSNMQNTNINHISVDTNGVLWLSTYSGLSTFNGSTFTHYTTQNSGIPSNTIRKTVIDNLNRKWLATYNDGIIRYDGTTWTLFNTNTSQIPTNMINDIAVDASNNVWIATEMGLTKFNGTTWTTYHEANSNLWSNNIESFGIDGSGNIYVSANGSVLQKFDGTSFTSITDGILRILKVQGNVVYGESISGYRKFVNGDQVESYYYFNEDSCLQDCVISALDLDEDNKVWLGYIPQCGNGGVQNFTDCDGYVESEEGTPFSYVTTLKVQSSSLIWFYVGELGLVKMTGSLGTNDSSVDKMFAYPNPVSNVLNLSSADKITSVSIHNMLGQEVLSKNINASDTAIDVSALSPGTYFVNLYADSGVKTLKVVKQ